MCLWNDMMSIAYNKISHEAYVKGIYLYSIDDKRSTFSIYMYISY